MSSADHRIKFDRPTEPPPPPPLTVGSHSRQTQAHTAALNNLADAIRELAAAFTGIRARVQADALRAAAEVYLLDPGDYRAWLRERADQIEREAREATDGPAQRQRDHIDSDSGRAQGRIQVRRLH